MRRVGSYEAKTHLPALLEEVANGESITITRHGTPVALLVPDAAERRQAPEELVRQLKQARKNNRLGTVSLRGLVEKGRRF